MQYIKPAVEGQRPNESQIEEVMEDCRICVVRRREAYGKGQSRFTTSIWAFSDDRSVRFQHERESSIIAFRSRLANPAQYPIWKISYHSPPFSKRKRFQLPCRQTSHIMI